MKKVKSIGKKVMSWGLAASLLLAPVGANNCCFADNEQAQQVNQGSSKVKDTLKKVGLAGVGVGSVYALSYVLLVIGAISGNDWCLKNGAGFGIAIEDLFNFVNQGILNLCNDMGIDIYNILDTIGFKDVFSAMGVGYAAKKACDITKWGYNKVVGLFRNKTQENREDNEFNMDEYGYFEISDNNDITKDEYEAAWQRIVAGY